MNVEQDRVSRNIVVSLERIDENTRRGIRQGFFRLGSSLVRTSSKQILDRSKKTGRIYRIRRGQRIRRHQASAPGQSPANLSGKYRRSFGFKIKGFQEMKFGSGLAMKEDYPEYLEKGTRKMKPRPGLGNAVDAEERNSITYFETEIARNVRPKA